jgi:ribonuclease-3
MPTPDELDGLQERLKARFRDPELLRRALRHRSAAIEQPLESMERLEFLGDSIVGVVVCDLLYDRFPEASEGTLAKAKAYLACEPTLAEAALDLGIDRALELSPSEEATGGRQRRSILSDAFEAVIAAIYLDQGMRAAKRVVRKALAKAAKRVAEDDYTRDYKSALQERTQAKNRKTPVYKIVEHRGADHDRVFVAQAMLGAKVLGTGEGRSKKEAEQAAARASLERWGEK